MTNEQSLIQFLKNSITSQTKQKNEGLDFIKLTEVGMFADKVETFHKLVEQSEFRIKWLETQLEQLEQLNK